MGIPCEYEPVYELAGRRQLRVIEDVAHAIGTRIGTGPIGRQGDFACYSFDAIKTVTCIDGGAIVCPSQEDASRLFPLRLLGMTQSNTRLYQNSRAYSFDVFGPGYRYHLANLHAAIGLSQLRLLPTFIGNRQKYCRLYSHLLSRCPHVLTPRSDFIDVSPFIYVVRVTGGHRERLRAHLAGEQIESGIHWIPGNQFTWLRDCRGADHVPVTDRIAGEMLTLPLWSFMDEAIIERVCESTRRFLQDQPARVR